MKWKMKMRRQSAWNEELVEKGDDADESPSD
jgi:hypothetical protein